MNAATNCFLVSLQRRSREPLLPQWNPGPLDPDKFRHYVAFSVLHTRTYKGKTILLTFTPVIEAIKNTKMIKFSSRLPGIWHLPKQPGQPGNLSLMASGDLAHWSTRFHRSRPGLLLDRQSHNLIMYSWSSLSLKFSKKCKVLQNYDCIKFPTYGELASMVAFYMCIQ